MQPHTQPQQQQAAGVYLGPHYAIPDEKGILHVVRDARIVGMDGRVYTAIVEGFSATEEIALAVWEREPQNFVEGVTT